MTGRRLLDKLWESHQILRREDGTSLLWVDRHLVHEGSHHAFAKIAERGVPVAEPGLTFGVADHYAPTRGAPATDAIARMIATLAENTEKHGITCFGLDDPRHSGHGLAQRRLVRRAHQLAHVLQLAPPAVKTRLKNPKIFWALWRWT